MPPLAADNAVMGASMGLSVPPSGLMNGSPGTISTPPHSPVGGSMVRSRAGHGSQTAVPMQQQQQQQQHEQIDVGTMQTVER